MVFSWNWITTRYDKLAANYLAFIKLAPIRMRADESTPLFGAGDAGFFQFGLQEGAALRLPWRLRHDTRK
jgi:hypothetical protein